MVRYAELHQESTAYLMEVPGALTIYPHYWMKHTGVWLNDVEIWIAHKGKNLWISTFNDPDLETWPNELLGKAKKYFFVPYAK